MLKKACQARRSVECHICCCSCVKCVKKKKKTRGEHVDFLMTVCLLLKYHSLHVTTMHMVVNNWIQI